MKRPRGWPCYQHPCSWSAQPRCSHRLLLCSAKVAAASALLATHPCLACTPADVAGGESTTMALVAERWGLIPELRQFASEQRPIWGTCAGLIFLANRASGEGTALLISTWGGFGRYGRRREVCSLRALAPLPGCPAPAAVSAEALPLLLQRSCRMLHSSIAAA